MPQAISFDGHDLQTANIVTAEIEHESPDRSIMFAQLAHANKSAISFDEWPDRSIPVSGKIIGSSIADCDAKIDLFRSYLLTKDANLDIGYNSTTRRYIATAQLKSGSIGRPNGLGYANFSIEFICTDPFGSDTTTTTAVNLTAQTTATNTPSYTFLGTAPWQQPIITVTFAAVSGGTGKTVTVGNGTTGQTIAITRDWIAADVLIVNAKTGAVTVNGLSVDYVGVPPEFGVSGSSIVSYADDFTTSRTYTLNAVYYKRYL